MDAADAAGCTGLHLASMHGHTAVMKTLLDSGANAHAEDLLKRLPEAYCEQHTWQKLLDERVLNARRK